MTFQNNTKAQITTSTISLIQHHKNELTVKVQNEWCMHTRVGKNKIESTLNDTSFNVGKRTNEPLKEKHSKLEEPV